MKLLTIDNAKEILEKGETYRIGTNALNVLEFTYEHKGFKTKNPNFKIVSFTNSPKCLEEARENIKKQGKEKHNI